MAMGITYVCSACNRSITAWEDGNPYYLDQTDTMQYACHPDHENLARCIGNDSPPLCLACGEAFMVDAHAPMEKCPKCDAMEIDKSVGLKGRRCPHCRAGVFTADPGLTHIL